MTCQAKTNSGPFGVPPGGPWFVFPSTGTIQRQSNPVLAAGLVNAEWVGFATQAEAKCFASKTDIGGKIISGAGHAVSSVTTSWVKDVFSGAGQVNLFVRIGEVAIGLVLIAVGVAKMTSAVPIATKVAKTVGAVGLI